MTPSLAVIVVNYNAGTHLERCLSSLVEHLSNVAWRAVVVDNASTDGSDQVVARFTPQVSLLSNRENLGFGRAINQGVSATSGDLLLFINPDGQLLPGAVEALCSELQRHQECAIVGPQIINDDGSTQGSARGDPDMLTGFFGRSTWLTRRFPRAGFARRNVVTGLEPKPGESGVEVDWVSGACMMVRRDVFNRLGGFDQRYFMYWEDADLCRRARSAGSRVRYSRDARVAHAVGVSSRTAQALATRAFHRSAYLYYTLHVAPSRWHPKRWLAFMLLRLRRWWTLTFPS